jgi:hypothetical protein
MLRCPVRAIISTRPIIRHKACFAPESGCTFELFSGNQGYLELVAKMNYGTLLLRDFLARAAPSGLRQLPDGSAPLAVVRTREVPRLRIAWPDMGMIRRSHPR